jgi:hypothetical protein
MVLSAPRCAFGASRDLRWRVSGHGDHGEKKPRARRGKLMLARHASTVPALGKLSHAPHPVDAADRIEEKTEDFPVLVSMVPGPQ